MYDTMCDREMSAFCLLRGVLVSGVHIAAPEDLSFLNGFISGMGAEVPKPPTTPLCWSLLLLHQLPWGSPNSPALHKCCKVCSSGGFKLFNFSLFFFHIEMDIKCGLGTYVWSTTSSVAGSLVWGGCFCLAPGQVHPVLCLRGDLSLYDKGWTWAHCINRTLSIK